MLTVEELQIIREALNTYSEGVLSWQFSREILDIQAKINIMIGTQGQK